MFPGITPWARLLTTWLLRLFHIREIVQEGKVSIHYVPTEDISDLWTKFLNKNRHRHLIGMLKGFKV